MQNRSIHKEKVLESSFLEDTLKLFSGRENGHMNTYAFFEKGETEDIKKNEGGRYWKNFIKMSKDYYLIPEEQEVIRNESENISNILPPNIVSIDLGPGEINSVERKTLYFNAALKKIKKFIAIDINPHFAVNASNFISSKLSIPTQSITENFLENNIGIQTKSPVVMTLFGGLLCNLSEGSISAENKLSSYFRNLRSQVKMGDYLVITQDTTREKEKLMKAYNHEYLDKYIMSVLYRIETELVNDNFNPDNFTFASVWQEEKSKVELCALAKSTCNFKIGGIPFTIPKGRKIPLVNCYKFTPITFTRAAVKGGWKSIYYKKPSQSDIAIHVLQAA